MSDLQTRIETLSEVAEKWLSDDNEHLLRAVHHTVDEDYFSFGDAQFALNVLKERFTQEALEEWVERSGITDKNDARGTNVLCLHAGNLPLVGFQNALAVLLSGARYSGKISRKDPYLLPSFLNEVKKTATWSGIDVQWSHRLDDFEDMPHDAILFAGSEQSVPEVREAINRYNLAKSEAEFLIRTAHFSMAYIKNDKEEALQKLAESILRYGGKGCRSVAVVVSPLSFEAVRDKLNRCMETFLKEHPQHWHPQPKLRQRYAYNKAIGRTQLWLDDFLLQEGGLELDQDFICYWVQEGAPRMSELANRFGEQLQSIFLAEPELEIPGYETEPLANAQQPPVYWKPDGIDTLNWLIEYV